MKFFDTHIHFADIKDSKYSIEKLISQGINKFIAVSILEKDWEQISNLYQQYPNNIVPAFGLHPWYIRDAKPGWEERLEAILLKHPEALVGETGLDRHKDHEFEPQNSFFKTHIELAKKLSRPLIIHAVKSQDWLENYWKILPAKFVFHSYNNRRELMKKILSHGGYISFSQAMLQNRERGKIAVFPPSNRLMIETDAPYQDLAENLINTAKDLAAIRKENLEDFAANTYQTAQEFIKIEK